MGAHQKFHRLRQRNSGAALCGGLGETVPQRASWRRAVAHGANAAARRGAGHGFETRRLAARNPSHRTAAGRHARRSRQLAVCAGVATVVHGGRRCRCDAVAVAARRAFAAARAASAAARAVGAAVRGARHGGLRGGARRRPGRAAVPARRWRRRTWQSLSMPRGARASSAFRWITRAETRRSRTLGATTG